MAERAAESIGLRTDGWGRVVGGGTRAQEETDGGGWSEKPPVLRKGLMGRVVGGGTRAQKGTAVDGFRSKD